MGNVNIRKTAVKILTEITYKHQYMNKLLLEQTKKLESDDKKYLNRVVNGVVENIMHLDYLLSLESKIKLKKLRDADKNILRLAVYEILYMDSIPNYASVNEAIILMKKSNYKLVKFTNGILRNFSENKDNIIEKYNNSFDNQIDRLSNQYSHPKWLVERWNDAFDLSFTEELLRSNNMVAMLSIRTNTLIIKRRELMDKLKSYGVKLYESKYVNEGIVITQLNGFDIFSSKEFKSGLFTVQDESSMLVSHIINPIKGDNILDLCAAPGGKATHIAQLLEDVGSVEARDVSYEKLYYIKENADRLKIKSIKLVLKDALILDDDSIDKYDKVLLDAPCSGFGIIRRKPDIKLNRQEDDIYKLAAIQTKMINNASKYVKIGGAVVFSTCTIAKEENELIIEEFLKTNNNFVKFNLEKEFGEELVQNGYLKTYPNVHGIDGFFACKLLRQI